MQGKKEKYGYIFERSPLACDLLCHVTLYDGCDWLQVLDENDNAPGVVEPVERTVSVRERQPAATPVLQILATDPDDGDNASLQYAFSTGAFAFL
jgi:hypothetical protein